MNSTGRHEQLVRLRESGTKRILALGLTTYPSVDALCQHLGELRARPIILLPMFLRTSDPCGLWIMARSEDFIIYDASTTRVHQEHIIMHELGHIISCHRGSGILDDTNARRLFPNLDPDLVRDMLLRASYDDVQEQEAEVIAYLLSKLIVPAGDLTSLDLHSPLDRIARVLG